MSKIKICYGYRKVTSSKHFKQCSSECGQSTHMGFISQTSGKVAISAAKYVWIIGHGPSPEKSLENRFRGDFLGAT